MSKLGEYLTIKHGWAFKGEFFSENGTQSILTPGNFYEKGGFKYNDEKERFYTGDYPPEYLCKKGDLIVAMTEQAAGLLGSTAIVPENNRYLHNQRVGLIICDENKLLPLYAYYLFMTKSVREQIARSSSGTKVKHTAPEKIYDVITRIPNTKTQYAVSDFLWRIDCKIQNNTRICTELESMAKTLYDYWFTQFDFPNADGKPYRSSGGEMVWNDQLKREIPKGWDVVPVTESFDVCYGFPFDTECFVEDPSAQPVVRIRDILEGSISAYTTEKVDKKYWLHSGDMIIGMDGNFHINFWDSKPALLNQRCVRIRSTCEYPVFMAYFSSLPYIKAREKTVSRTTVGHLSADDIKALYVFKPDAATLASVKSIFNAALEKICQVQDENRELTKLRDWLLPMLMNGQATVE